MERRKFITNSRLLAAGTLALGCTTKTEPPATEGISKPSIRPNPIGVSTYSFWRFNGPKEETPIEMCIEKAAVMGFDGIELLLVQMAS